MLYFFTNIEKYKVSQVNLATPFLMKCIKCGALLEPFSDIIFGALTYVHECDEIMIQQWEQEHIPQDTNNQDNVDKTNVRTVLHEHIKQHSINQTRILHLNKTETSNLLSVCRHHHNTEIGTDNNACR